MAMVWDPISKQWIDDGTGLDAAAPLPGMSPPAPDPSVAPPPLAAGSGGGAPIPAAPGTTIQIGSAPPERETTTSSQQLVKSAASKQADADLAAAGRDVMAGSAAQEQVDLQEGEIKSQGAAEEERQREQAMLDQAALREKRRLAIQDAQREDDEQVKLVTKAAQEKNDAEIDYFKGRPAAEIFTALLRAADRAASSFRGETGPTGSDRVVSEKIAAYKARKLGIWESKKEVRAAKKAQHASYQEALAQEEIAINNQLLAGLEVLRARTEKLAAQLTPEKAAALRQQRDAAFSREEARLKQEREQNYDKLEKFSETRRSGGPPAGMETKPPPLASVDDTEKVTKLEQIAQERESLADQIEKADAGAWKDLQVADKKHQREEGLKLPWVGNSLVGTARAIGSSDLSGRVQRALGQPVGGISVEDKLRYNPGAQALWRGISKVVTQEAKDLGGAVTASDLDAKRAELGVQGQSAKEMAATLRRQASEFRDRARQMRGQRTFVEQPVSPPAGGYGAAVREKLGAR